MPVAEILSQGDEVVTGQVADTNAQWLSTRLTELGFTVRRHTAVPDDVDEIVTLFREVSTRCDLALSTGGLGPTEDDLTAAAIATAFERPLAFDETAMAHIEALYARFRRKMPDVNRKQAWLPRGCTRLDNDWGTAPGFAVETTRAWMAFMPGVPREMFEMFEHRVLPEIEARFDVHPGRLITLRTTGIGESTLQERIGEFSVPDVVLSFRTKLPENHVKLRFPAGVPDPVVERIVETLAQRIGSSLFAIDGLPGRPQGSLIEVVAAALLERHHTLAAAESCTGGGVSALCTSLPGSSGWFLEGVVAYANSAKTRLLGVPEALLAEHGAVSEPVAIAMAEGARERSGATWGLSTTGIAGPDGGSEHKPVGTVHIALSGPDRRGAPSTLHRKLHLAGSRHRIQTLAVASVIDLLRRRLQDLI